MITWRHFSYQFIITERLGATAKLLRSLKPVLWKKSAFYVHYLHNNITVLLVPKVQNNAYFLNFLNKSDSLIAVFLLSFWKCPNIFFINGIFSTQNLSGGMFFTRSYNQIFMMLYLFLQIVSLKWEEKHRVPDTYHTNSSYTNVMNYVDIT